MSQNLKLMADWQRSIAPLFRELGRLAHLQLSDDAKRFYGSDEVRHVLAVLRAGKDEKSEGSQAVYRDIGKLHPNEAVELFRKMGLFRQTKRPPKRRGRELGNGPFVSEDERLLKVYYERVAAGESPRAVIDEIANQARTHGIPKARKDRLQKKIRRRARTPRKMK